MSARNKFWSTVDYLKNNDVYSLLYIEERVALDDAINTVQTSNHLMGVPTQALQLVEHLVSQIKERTQKSLQQVNTFNVRRNAVFSGRKI